jgi:hypothetical protein
MYLKLHVKIYILNIVNFTRIYVSIAILLNKCINQINLTDSINNSSNSLVRIFLFQNFTAAYIGKLMNKLGSPFCINSSCRN